MKICVTAQEDNLDAQVDPRFGRCLYFMIIDTETSDFEAVQNPNVSGMGGVGVRSGQLMSEKDVKAVLTGNVGPNAFRTLEAAGIDVITGLSGTVREAVEKYRSGDLKPDDDPSVDEKCGMS